MGLRDSINDAMKEAMRAKDTLRLSTIRLMTAAFKDREIELRATGATLDDPAMLQALGKMVKQRQESAKVYREGGRPELAEKEEAEIRVIEDFLPRQLSADEVRAAIASAVAETGAASIKDMGRVMGVLKGKYTGQMDFGAVGALIKAQLGS